MVALAHVGNAAIGAAPNERRGEYRMTFRILAIDHLVLRVRDVKAVSTF